MAIARSVATVTSFAVLALGLAAPSCAATELSGHYTETATAANGHQFPANDWYFTSCGDGCALLANTPDGQAHALAYFANGHWTMEDRSSTTCQDGSTDPDAIYSHFTWDPSTLAGTEQATQVESACGESAGSQFTNSIQLARAS